MPAWLANLLKTAGIVLLTAGFVGQLMSVIGKLYDKAGALEEKLQKTDTEGQSVLNERIQRTDGR